MHSVPLLKTVACSLQTTIQIQMSSLNRIDNTAYSINNQAGVLHYSTKQCSHVHSTCKKCPLSAAMQACSLLRHSLIAGPRLQEPDRRGGVGQS